MRKLRCSCHIGECTSSNCALILKDRDIIYLLHTTKCVTDQTKAHRLFFLLSQIQSYSLLPQNSQRKAGFRTSTGFTEDQQDKTIAESKPKNKQLHRITAHRKWLIHSRNVNYYIYMLKGSLPSSNSEPQQAAGYLGLLLKEEV